MDEPRHRLAHVEQRDGPPRAAKPLGARGGRPAPSARRSHRIPTCLPLSSRGIACESPTGGPPWLSGRSNPRSSPATSRRTTRRSSPASGGYAPLAFSTVNQVCMCMDAAGA